MVRLASPDFKMLSESIRKIYALQDPKDFPNHIISIIREVIPWKNR